MRGGFCSPYWRLSGQESQRSRMDKDAGNSQKVFLRWAHKSTYLYPMDFRTEISVHPSPHPIGLNDPIMTLGSCFAQSIGEQFDNNRFQVEVNPFGTTYHPLAIHKLL